MYVRDTRLIDEGVKRRRECDSCHIRMNTIEIPTGEFRNLLNQEGVVHLIETGEGLVGKERR